MRRRDAHWPGAIGFVLGGMLLFALVLPLVNLALSSTFDQIKSGIQHASFSPALWLSLRTTCVSLVLIVVTGLPVAWWLAMSRSRLTQLVGLLVDLPLVIPPAVIGVSLLLVFGQQGLLGSLLANLGIQVAFTETAVILAQVVVSAPFFIQAAANAFRKVDQDMLIVARTLGANRSAAFLRIAIPIAAPGLIAGASLAWARSLGEFGATLMFAGNMPGTTQTMPLAIYTTLHSNVKMAVVFSLVLAAAGALLLLALRCLPAIWRPQASRTQPQESR